MLTARGEETDRIVGLELGADDYIVKPFSAREVAARIRAVLRRAGDTAPTIAPPARPRRRRALEVGPVRIDPSPRDRRASAGDDLDLTRKEFELLDLLMSEAGSVISRERLIDEVWDVELVRLDEDARRPRLEPPPQARRRLGQPPLHPHRPRRRLPLRLRRRAMSLRARLVLAFTYVLVLVDRRARGAAGAQPVEAGRRRDQERGPQPDRAARGGRGRPAERRRASSSASSRARRRRSAAA